MRQRVCRPQLKLKLQSPAGYLARKIIMINDNDDDVDDNDDDDNVGDDDVDDILNLK